MKTTALFFSMLCAAPAFAFAAEETTVPAPAPVSEPAAEPAKEPAREPEKRKIELNALEEQFQKTMTGATLVGRFTVDGKEDKIPAEEKYVISKATKIGDDLWLLSARIGESRLPIPLPVPVKWAGDTPVISVTKMKVPGMGTYTARVMIYSDHYAGTWDAGDHGGHLWGRIERLPASKPTE